MESGLPRSMWCTKIIDEKKVNDERRNKAKKIPEKEKNSKRKKIMLEAKGLRFRQLTTTWWLRIFEYKSLVEVTLSKTNQGLAKLF